MFRRVTAARLQYIEDEIGLYVGVGIGNEVAHVGLRGQIHHDLRPVLLEQLHDQRLLRDVPFDEQNEGRYVSSFNLASFGWTS